MMSKDNTIQRVKLNKNKKKEGWRLYMYIKTEILHANEIKETSNTRNNTEM